MGEIPRSPADIIFEMKKEKVPRPDVGSFECPESNLEKQIATVWEDVLRIDRVGRLDNLFVLGGDSIHMLQIVSRLRQTLDIQVSISDFFESPTVLGLASRAMQRN
jgi:acyl carrier protein